MTENKPIIYYKKDCFNEPYCSLKEVLEQLHRYKQVIEEIKELAENNMDDKQIMTVQTMLNGSPDVKNKILEQII